MPPQAAQRLETAQAPVAIYTVESDHSYPSTRTLESSVSISLFLSNLRSNGEFLFGVALWNFQMAVGVGMPLFSAALLPVGT